MPTKNHLHILERIGSRKQPNARFRCIDPDCFFYLTADMLRGKRAACECGTPYILTSALLRYKRPKCAKCSTGKRRADWERKQKSHNVFKDILKADIIQLGE